MFPEWAEVLGLGDVRLVACDLPLHAPRDEYRAVVERSPTRPDDVAALLLAETDELVDATNTLNSVIDAVGQPSVVSG